MLLYISTLFLKLYISTLSISANAKHAWHLLYKKINSFSTAIGPEIMFYLTLLNVLLSSLPKIDRGLFSRQEIHKCFSLLLFHVYSDGPLANKFCLTQWAKPAFATTLGCLIENRYGVLNDLGSNRYEEMGEIPLRGRRRHSD